MSDLLKEIEARDRANARRKAMCGDAPAPLSDYRAKLAHTVDRVSKEDEQKILDLLHEGKNVGQIAEIMKMESIVIATIYSNNIKSYGHFLAKKVEE